MKTVMAFGTFDIIHPGHRYFLNQAKKLGNYLTVIIARDATVFKVKDKLPHHKEKQRQKAIFGLNLADKVILGYLNDKYALIKKYRPDIIALGYDQNHFTVGLKEKLKDFKLKTKIVRINAHKPHKYKSSIIKNKYEDNHLRLGKIRG